jgi:hypothetical protein
MGWPRNWTSLDPCCTVCFDEWRLAHGQGEHGTATGTEEDQAQGGMRNVWWENDPSEASQGRGLPEQCDEQRDDSLPGLPHEGASLERDMGAREGAGGDLQDMRGSIPACQASPVEPLRETGVPGRERKACSCQEVVPRVAGDVPSRVDRLKAIGNGQVPAVVRLAWETLSEVKA